MTESIKTQLERFTELIENPKFYFNGGTTPLYWKTGYSETSQGDESYLTIVCYVLNFEEEHEDEIRELEDKLIRALDELGNTLFSDLHWVQLKTPTEFQLNNLTWVNCYGDRIEILTSDNCIRLIEFLSGQY